MNARELLYKACEWQADTLRILEGLQVNKFEIKVEVPNGKEVDIDLTEEMKKGFRLALILIERHIRTFPVRYGVEDQESEE